MRCWWLIPLLLIISSPSHGQAFLRRLARVSDVADVGSAVAKEKDRSAEQLKDVVSRNPQARGLLRTKDGLLLLDPSGSSELALRTPTRERLLLPEDVAAQFRQHNLLVSYQQIDVLRSVILQVNAIREGAAWALDGGNAGRLRLVPSLSADFIYEYRKRVYAPYADEDLTRLLRVKSRRSEGLVLSWLGSQDVAGRQALATALGKQYRAANDWSLEQLEQVLRAHAQGAVFVVGETPAKTSTALALAARDADVTLVRLSCTGECWVPADQGKLRSLQASLRAALDANQVGDTLEALAQTSGDVFLTRGPADGLRVQLATELLPRRNVDARPMVAMEVLALSPSRDRELMMRIVPGIPGPLQIAYLVGLAFVIVGIKTVISGWRLLAQPTPSIRSAPFAFAAINLLRGLGFIALLPLAWAVSLTLMLGLWAVPVVIAVYWGYTIWSGFVGMYFGIRWASAHAREVSDEHFLSRYLSVPLLASALMLGSGSVVWLSVSVMRWLGMAPADAHWADAVLALAISYLLGRAAVPWLIERNWIPSTAIGWLMVGPLWLIERGVRWAVTLRSR